MPQSWARRTQSAPAPTCRFASGPTRAAAAYSPPVALSVCLLLDEPAERAVRGVWQRLETAGVPTLLSHTHGRHLPHLSLASLRTFSLDQVAHALAALPAAPDERVHFDGLGMFRRSRCWLLPAVTRDLLDRQARVVEALAGTGADLHRHYLPGSWLPHLTLAPRLHLADLPLVARTVFEVLPLAAGVSRAALVDTSNGQVSYLPHLV